MSIMNIDTNISNYSLAELLDITGIIYDEDINTDVIQEKTDALITKFKKNPKISHFFRQVQGQLLHYAQGLKIDSNDDSDEIEDIEDNEDNKIIVEGFGTRTNDAEFPEGDKQSKQWFENQYESQTDENQLNKITKRQQRINIFGTNHGTMKRQQIATTDTFNLPLKQDSLNPNLKNTITRFVNLDSQFRQYTNGTESSSTDYTLDLSDSLKDALSLSLYSYQIPYSWYAIDEVYGNNCFWIHDPVNNQDINVFVPSGNYTATSFQSQLNSSFQNSGFTTPAVPGYVIANNPVYYNANNGKITLFLNGGTYTDPLGVNPSFIMDPSCSIIFYDFTGQLNCFGTTVSRSNHYFNNTLGWIMGYRVPYENIEVNGNIASSILDLNGTKYLILVVDDYNQNHVNNSLVSIAQNSNVLKMPSYYSEDLPYTYITQEQSSNNLQEIIDELTLQTLVDTQSTNIQNGLLIAGKYYQTTPTQQVLPSAPRTLTKSQIYTINEINKNNSSMTSYLSKAPTSTDILAIVPVKTSTGVPVGSLLVEFSGSLQDNKRTYFGPVNIERMNVKLLDDKGNLLNLNGNDWCVTLICESLYQY